MSEASLDLEALKAQDMNRLSPAGLNSSLFTKDIRNLTKIGLMIAVLANLTRWILDTPPYLNLLIIFLLYNILRYSEKIKDSYSLSDRGLMVPYTWISRKMITWPEIARVERVKLQLDEHETDAIEILLQTSKLRYNTTGIRDSAIYITSDNYNREEWKQFYTTLHEHKRERGEVPDTLSHRLEHQVNNAWKNRYGRLILEVIDNFSRWSIYLFIVYIIMISFYPMAVPTKLFIVIMIIVLLLVLIANIPQIPDRIVGMRPNELGPLLYNEEQMFTSVRLISMIQPDTVRILHADIIYGEGEIPQSQRLKQIEPRELKPGELKHVVIQFYGNHSKASGIKLFLKSPRSDTEHTIEQHWA